MAVDPDEEALTWAGEEDARPAAAPAQTKAAKPAKAGNPAKTVTTASASDGAPEMVEVIDEPAKPQISSLLLVTFGVLAGAHLIYTLGWVVSIQGYSATHTTSPDPLTAIMFGVTEFLAIASPIIWFGAVLALTRGRKAIIRLLWLLLGLVVVIPWPFVLGAWSYGR
jgi:hypothetical protein